MIKLLYNLIFKYSYKFDYLYYLFDKKNFLLKFNSSENLIEDLLKLNKSLIRLGDGEIAILNKQDIHFQKYEPELREKLLNLIKNYNVNSNYLLGIPTDLIKLSNEDLIKINQFRFWYSFKIYFKNIFNKSTIYYDSLYFRTKIKKNDINKLLLNKKIILVTNSKNYNSFKSRFSNLTYFKFIKTSDKNVFSDYNNILKKLKKV